MQLAPAPALDGPEEQFMDVVHLPLVDAIAMIATGEITASNTVIGLLLAERRLRERGLLTTP